MDKRLVNEELGLKIAKETFRLAPSRSRKHYVATVIPKILDHFALLNDSKVWLVVRTEWSGDNRYVESIDYMIHDGLKGLRTFDGRLTRSHYEELTYTALMESKGHLDVEYAEYDWEVFLVRGNRFIEMLRQQVAMIRHGSVER